MAGVCEATLNDRVVFWEVAECKGVADIGCDDLGGECEFGIGADGDGDVGCMGEGEEEGDDGEGEGGMHDVVALDS